MLKGEQLIGHTSGSVSAAEGIRCVKAWARENDVAPERDVGLLVRGGAGAEAMARLGMVL